jgi:hypothetical protein
MIVDQEGAEHRSKAFGVGSTCTAGLNHFVRLGQIAGNWLQIGYASETNSDQNNLSRGRTAMPNGIAERHKEDSALVRYIPSDVLVAGSADVLAD